MNPRWFKNVVGSDIIFAAVTYLLWSLLTYGMFGIPYEDLIAKIEEGAGISREEIEQKIAEKLNQFSGLISKEGAAHIIANELGVRLAAPSQGRLIIKNIVSGMRSVDVLGKVMRLDPVRTFQKAERSGSLASMMIADESGSIRVVAWGDQTQIWSNLKEGDIVKISGAYVKDNNEQKELHVGERSRIIINPPGETIKDVQVPSHNTARKSIAELKDDDGNVEIHGVVVQAFEPRFFEVCGSCGKRSRAESGSFICPTHGPIVPEFSYVASLVLDDGTETIRISCFRQQVEQLFGKTPMEMLAYKDTPEAAIELRQSVIGKIMTFVGRVKKNEVFDRREVVAQTVNPSPNPGDELRRLMN